ncbi:hypothetical protein QA645_00775 [Bradyrhizobium sp. CIAT3101]|jgi:hypothetical protein|uniref:hypothetical protein n=1 Tax=Bradyrhizobium sp. CIAT3101 TaxID=439387 RepID=UPI0024B18CBF|nr:hypothetical protein [Bradyrhizobium sp. CIAT3101]WFU81319.1 hypothetical protein QA645_00775 [Bradyrhizobium sp. CIAT3101]
MIVGDEYRRLEKRLNNALLSGKANPRESIFLHKISTRISEYGKNARLTDRQASYLMSILDRLSPAKARTTASTALKPDADSNRGEPNSMSMAQAPEAKLPATSPALPSERDEAIPPDSNFFVPPPSNEATFSQLRAEDIQVPKDWISKALARAAARREHEELLKKLGRRL